MEILKSFGFKGLFSESFKLLVISNDRTMVKC